MVAEAMTSNSHHNHNDGSTSTPSTSSNNKSGSSRPEILNGIRNYLGSSTYREMIESSSTYNNGIVVERKLRLPYLDSQTGVAQSDCFLWFKKSDRIPGVDTSSGQLYQYPAKRWKKKRRQYLMNDHYLTRNRSSATTSEHPNGTSFDHDSNSNMSAEGQPSSSSNNVKSESAIAALLNDSAINGKQFNYENSDSKGSWFSYDDGSDLPDAGELDEDSDFDDYEEYSASSRKKKKSSSSRKESAKKKRVEYSDAEKPFACDICGARYKTRPGLSYHYTHTHHAEAEGGLLPEALVGEGMPFTPPRPSGAPPPSTSAATPSTNPNQAPALLPTMLAGAGPRASPLPPTLSGANAPPSRTESPNTSSTVSSHDGFGGIRPLAKGSIAPPQDYCDFCLGDSVENKKTKSAESLVSCSDCGRSAHPTCLQFTDNMIASVKKYRWQCIECKSCGLCGTSDNDDQLLFCDDCDRGYHMYCLKPPLAEPPEGSWSCHLCIVEYHSKDVPKPAAPAPVAAPAPAQPPPAGPPPPIPAPTPQ